MIDWFLYLSKLLPVVVYPLGLSMTLLAAGAVFATARRPAIGRALAGTAIALLWVCSSPVFAGWLLGALERQYPARALADTPEAEVVIVLGGAIGQPVPPRVDIDLTAASDRVLHASRLYRAGKARRVVVAAGNIPWIRSVKPEAELIRDLLVEWGVPSNAIEILGGSRNTYENAVEVRDYRARRNFQSALLVTSAAHMPRAMAVFRRLGIPVTASTTDVEVTDALATDLMAWLPDAGALAVTTAAVKEWVGIGAYRMLGYL